MTPETRIDGKLEIVLKKGQIKIIYATRIVSNEGESWKYVQKNGRRLVKKSQLNPELMAQAMGKAYREKGIDGQINWEYNPNHTQNEKMVPEEIPESV